MYYDLVLMQPSVHKSFAYISIMKFVATNVIIHNDYAQYQHKNKVSKMKAH